MSSDASTPDDVTTAPGDVDLAKLVAEVEDLRERVATLSDGGTPRSG